MPDLNEKVEILNVQQIEKKTWDRSNEITILHEFQGTPVMIFNLQRLTTINGTVTKTEELQQVQSFFDQSVNYPLLNPVDDSEIPNEVFVNLPRHSQIHVLIYSEFKNLMSTEV